MNKPNLLLAYVLVILSSNFHLVFGQCDNVTYGGKVGYDQWDCQPFDPDPILNINMPAGGTGALEFMWFTATDTYDFNTYIQIPGATGPSFDPAWANFSAYYLRCSRRAGCVTWAGEAYVFIEVEPIDISISTGFTGCDGNGGWAVANPSPIGLDYSYFWSTGDTTPSISGLPIGNYSVTVTTPDGCAGTATGAVPGPGGVVFQYELIHPRCSVDSPAGLSYLHANAPGGPVTILVDGNHYLGGPITNMNPGVHSLIGITATGCTTTTSFVIREPAILETQISETGYPCVAGTYRIHSSVLSGRPPFSYLWSNGDTTRSIIDPNPGLYSVTVTDSLGCTSTNFIQIPEYGPPAATMRCCQDTVLCEGGTASLVVDLTGSAPWSLTWYDGAGPHTANVYSSPYTIQVSPAGPVNVFLNSVANDCGTGPVCGNVKVVPQDCTPEACLTGCFNSRLDQIISLPGGCQQYVMTISCTGCPTELSNLTMQIGCGDVSNYLNSLGYPMTEITHNDPNSGLKGLKVDNISGFCSQAGNAMVVSYTLCPEAATCFNLPDCGPVIAYKAGNCLYYEEVIPAVPNRTFQPYIDVHCWPNPSMDNVRIGWDVRQNGLAKVQIANMASGQVVRGWELDIRNPGPYLFEWDGKDGNGNSVPQGVYLLKVQMGEATGQIRVNRMR